MSHRETRLYRRFIADLGVESIIAPLEEVREYWDALYVRETMHGVSEDHPDSYPLKLSGRSLVAPDGRAWTIGDVRLRVGDLEVEVSSYVTPPESGHQSGLTSVYLELEFRGISVQLIDSVEGEHGDWADALVRTLRRLLGPGGKESG